MNNNTLSLIFIGIIIIQALGVVNIYSIKKDINQLGIQMDWIIANLNPMMSKNTTRITKIVGIYYPTERYYCVDIENNDPVYVSRIESHEVCHHLVNMDEEKHFCK